MNKPVNLGLSILDLSKTVIYGFWFCKTKIWWKFETLWYGYRQLHWSHVKTDDIYKHIAEDVETTFDTSNFEKGRPLPKGKNKKVIGLIKDKLGGEIMKGFVGLRAKAYSYLKDKNNEDKKEKATKKCARKRKFKF